MRNDKEITKLKKNQPNVAKEHNITFGKAITLDASSNVLRNTHLA